MPVTLGIDNLVASGLRQLHGKKVALITNHTGYASCGRSTIEILFSSPHVDLVVLFSPEHGIQGAVDDEVSDGVHSETNLPIYSLYGSRSKPGSDQLKGIDIMVYDIQDIGTRFYTYISTLLSCLQAASETGIPLMVLDRPNPIGGERVEGPLADSGELSFVACHPLPVRHGLTVGELAKLFVYELDLSVDLTVIVCGGWDRSQYWDETGLLWINPSPNIRSLSQAVLYSGIALPEFTNLSVGRGTNYPFQIVGAPWVDPIQFTNELRANSFPGVSFMPVLFSPNERQYAGERCGGVQLEIINRETMDSVSVGMGLMRALRRTYRDEWRPVLTNTLLANQRVYTVLEEGDFDASLSFIWENDLRDYKSRVKPHLMYHE